MTTRTLAAALAALLLCGAARAETDEEGGPVGEIPARVQASSGVALGGAGVHAGAAPRPESGVARSAKKAAQPTAAFAINVVPNEGAFGSDGNPQAHANVPQRPPVQYSSYKSAPHDRRITAQLYMNFNAGPGTTLSVGFKGPKEPGGWEWAEHLDGTYNCSYSAWVSESRPGLGVAGPNCGIHSGTIGNLWFGPAIRNSVEQQTLCKLTPGRQYFLNLRLDSWEANPNAHDLKACVEYLKTNGMGGFEIMAQ